MTRLHTVWLHDAQLHIVWWVGPLEVGVASGKPKRVIPTLANRQTCLNAGRGCNSGKGEFHPTTPEAKGAREVPGPIPHGWIKSITKTSTQYATTDGSQDDDTGRHPMTSTRPILLSSKTSTRIATWNVTTMYETGKTAQVVKEMRRLNIGRRRWYTVDTGDGIM